MDVREENVCFLRGNQCLSTLRLEIHFFLYKIDCKVLIIP